MIPVFYPEEHSEECNKLNKEYKECLKNGSLWDQIWSCAKMERDLKQCIRKENAALWKQNRSKWSEDRENWRQVREYGKQLSLWLDDPSKYQEFVQKQEQMKK